MKEYSTTEAKLVKKSFQTELWHECNNLCEFCYLGNDNRKTSDEIKIESLRKTYKTIENLNFDKYKNISFIGGEFYQGQLSNPEVRAEFFKLMSKVHDLLKDGVIESTWITATMTIGDNKDLYDTLDLFSDINVTDTGYEGLWISTSWDTKGRFHTPKHKETWEYHMKNIHKKYPYIKFVTCIIMTKWFCETIVNGTFDLHEFADEFNTTFFFKQPGVISLSDKEFFEIMDKADNQMEAAKKIQMDSKLNLEKTFPGMYPTRELFLKTLFKIASFDKYIYDRLFNIHYRADTLVRQTQNDEMVNVIQERQKNAKNEMSDEFIEAHMINDCGHMLAYAPYIDSNECCLCDKFMIEEMI